MPPSSPGSRAERRAETARRILRAARSEFASHGYDKTTIRAIAARAGVDPSLIMQHHGSKAALFRSAVQLEPAARADVGSHLDDVLDSRIAGLPPELHALVRSMLTEPAATEAIREYLDERVVNLARTLSGPTARTDAALAVSTILGITIGRHFLQLTGLDDVSEEELARAARSWLAAGLRHGQDEPGR